MSGALSPGASYALRTTRVVSSSTGSCVRRMERAPRALQEALEDPRLLVHRPAHYYVSVPLFDELLARPLPTAAYIAGVRPQRTRPARAFAKAKLASLHTELPTDG